MMTGEENSPYRNVKFSVVDESSGKTSNLSDGNGTSSRDNHRLLTDEDSIELTAITAENR